MSFEDAMGKLGDELIAKILKKISDNWKKEVDIKIKELKRQNKKLRRLYEKQVDAFNFEREKYNQLVHEKNLEMTAMSKFTIELQSIIEKLKNKEVFNDETK